MKRRLKTNRLYPLASFGTLENLDVKSVKSGPFNVRSVVRRKKLAFQKFGYFLLQKAPSKKNLI